jgi:hypothetical protein
VQPIGGQCDFDKVQRFEWPALDAKLAALNSLLTAGGGGNLSETMWLRAEIAAVQATLENRTSA